MELLLFSPPLKRTYSLIHESSRKLEVEQRTLWQLMQVYLWGNVGLDISWGNLLS